MEVRAILQAQRTDHAKAVRRQYGDRGALPLHRQILHDEPRPLEQHHQHRNQRQYAMLRIRIAAARGRDPIDPTGIRTPSNGTFCQRLEVGGGLIEHPHLSSQRQLSIYRICVSTNTDTSHSTQTSNMTATHSSRLSNGLTTSPKKVGA